MLRQLVNECVIDLHIKPDGPLLIKSGLAQVSGPDMAWVRVFRNGKEEVYLPGSSLKGVLRSHAERIARTLNLSAACDPFAKAHERLASCGSCFEDRNKREPFKGEPIERKNRLVYRDSCPICRLFGSTWYAGRLATADAYADGQAPEPVERDGVGIDRFTGGASRGAKFELEVITAGVFATTLHLRNFELWQAGLLGFVLEDLADGLLRIGMGKSRGLGKVRGEVRNVRLDFLGPKAPKPADGQLLLRGVGSLFDNAAEYGMVAPDEVAVPFSGEVRERAIRTTVVFADNSFPWAAIAPRWPAFLQDWQDPMAQLRKEKEGRR